MKRSSWSGKRREETDKAPWVDFRRQRIILPAGFVKGVEDQYVPLDPKLREALDALPRLGRRVFQFTPSGQALGRAAISTRVVNLARQAGVKLAMKSLRKGFGCRYAGRVSAHVLQRLLRHANIKTTLEYYVNIDAAVEEAVLGKKEPQKHNICANTEPPALDNSSAGLTTSEAPDCT